jgi:hypothetical protein
MGKVWVPRPYYQCQLSEEGEEPSCCSHGQAPFDAVWGIEAGRSSPGVQKLASYLGASLTLEEAAAVFQATCPLKMSARQVLNLMEPVGEALRCREDAGKERLFQEATNKETIISAQEKEGQEAIERLYVEMDGVLARMRRGSVLIEEQEKKRSGDVYREIKVGAVFTAMRGRTRSDLAAGTFVDAANPIAYVARRTTAETFGPYLSALAKPHGIERAKQVVVLGDGAAWMRACSRRTVSGGRANGRSLACT